MFDFLKKSRALDPNNPEQMNSPDTVPGSVGNRTANNRPLYIIVAIIAGFLLVVVTVGVQRSSRQNQPGATPPAECELRRELCLGTDGAISVRADYSIQSGQKGNAHGCSGTGFRR